MAELKILGLAGIGREQAALRQFGARQAAQKRVQQTRLNEILRLTPDALQGDRMAQANLAARGVRRFPKSDAELAAEEADKNRRAQERTEAIDFKKQQEKRISDSLKTQQAQIKASSEESKRRFEVQTAGVERREKARDEARKEARKIGLSKELDEETRKSKEGLAEFEANKKLWEPLAEIMFPKMSPEEQEAQVEALARRRAPSISEQRLPQVMAEKAKTQQAQELWTNKTIKDRTTPPTAQPVTFPDPPDISEATILKQLQGSLIRDPREVVPGQRTLNRYFGTNDVPGLRAAIQTRKATILAEWERETKEAQEKQARNAAAVQEYATQVKTMKGIMTQVPGEIGAAMAGIPRPVRTPEQKGRLAARQAKAKAFATLPAAEQTKVIAAFRDAGDEAEAKRHEALLQ